MDIDDWRIEIDRIDEHLVDVLNQRSRCAIEIGKLKRSLGLPVYSPDREKQVLEHVVGINGGPLEPSAIKRLFERIIDESRRIERVMIEKEAGEQNPKGATAPARRKKRGR